jgi:hypothetical protein
MSKGLVVVLLLIAGTAHADSTDPFVEEYAKSGKRCASGQQKACQELLRVALADREGPRGIGAASWLTDQQQLANVARNAAALDVRLVTVSRVADQAALSLIARESQDDALRAAALRRLTDPEVIAERAWKDSSPWVQAEAVRRLKDQDALAEIARSHPGVYAREAAVETLGDESLLVLVALDDPDVGPATRAAYRIKEPARSAEIARRSRHAAVRAGAVDRVTDVALIADLARHDADERVRRAAVGRLRGDTATSPMRPATIRRAGTVRGRRPAHPCRTPDRSIFRDLALSDTSDRVRASAVGMAKDAVLVAQMARSDKSPQVRLAAVRAAEDPSLLAEVGMKDDDAEVRTAALGKLARLPKLPEPSRPTALSPGPSTATRKRSTRSTWNTGCFPSSRAATEPRGRLWRGGSTRLRIPGDLDEGQRCSRRSSARRQAGSSWDICSRPTMSSVSGSTPSRQEAGSPALRPRSVESSTSRCWAARWT